MKGFVRCVLLVPFICLSQPLLYPKDGGGDVSRIFWDAGSLATVFSPGNYCRIIELDDGRLLAAAEACGGISIASSADKGATWSKPVCIAASPDSIFYAVPDLIQLSDGTVLVGFNPRPVPPYSTDRLFGIRVMRSTDNGATWEGPVFVYDARHTFGDGCWEPSFIELESGEDRFIAESTLSLKQPHDTASITADRESFISSTAAFTHCLLTLEFWANTREFIYEKIMKKDGILTKKKHARIATVSFDLNVLNIFLCLI